MYWIRRVYILDDAKVSVYTDKYKANKIFLGKRERITDLHP